MLSNCMVSHPSRANMSLQWEAQTSTTRPHLLTCSQTPWHHSNCSHIQDIWIYNLISIRFWLRFQGLVEMWGSQGGDNDVACHLGPAIVSQWICNIVWEEPAASITLIMEGAGTLKCWCISCQTTLCHNWEYLWCQISLVCKRQTATIFTFIPSVNYVSFIALG